MKVVESIFIEPDPSIKNGKSVEVFYKYEVVNINGQDHLKYRNFEAFNYAKKWCSKKNNSCGLYFEGQNRSDCAHFLSHCLHNGGLTIYREDGPDECKDKLTARVKVIIKILRALSEKYSNIYPIPYDEAILGDPAFLNTFLNPSHAVLVHVTKQVDGNPNKRETFYYAHSKERCSSKGDLKWYQSFGEAFRIYDAR